MYSVLVIAHALVCLLLAVVILMQSGRGGGLTEGFASAESMLGAKTNTFMIKTTAVFATLFLVLSLALAFVSTTKEKSIMPSKVALPTGAVEDLPAADDLDVPEGVAPEAVESQTQDVLETNP